MTKKVLIVLAIVAVVYILTKLLKFSNVVQKAGSFIAELERFVSKPYWDYKQWSWGYGTKVPDSTSSPSVVPNKIITKDQAQVLMNKHITNDYNVLKPLVKKELTPNQWASLLSFTYNLGIGTGKTMVGHINRNASNLEQLWKAYIYAGGVPNNGLIDRRNKEWKLYNS